MIPGLSDLAFVHERLGVWAAVALLLFGIIVYLAYRYVSRKTDDVKTLITRFDETLGLLRLSVVTEEGQVLNQEEQRMLLLKLLALLEEISEDLNSRIGRHMENVERLASEEHWKHCDIDRCANLSNIVRTMEQMRQYMNDFVEQGKEHRQVTLNMISDVFSRLDLFLVEVIKTTNILSGGKNAQR